MEFTCPKCEQELGIDPGDQETKFYCNNCKIELISFPNPIEDAYTKFCECVSEKSNKIDENIQKSTKKITPEDKINKLFGYSADTDFKFSKNKNNSELDEEIERVIPNQEKSSIDSMLYSNNRNEENLPSWLHKILYSHDYYICDIRQYPETEAEFVPNMKIKINQKIKSVLEKKGIKELYKYQKLAFKSILSGNNVVVTAPTASGKTEAFIIPILNKILDEPNHKGVYAVIVYPTKALASDQKNKIEKYANPCDITIKTIDGDTPPDQRKKIWDDPPNILVTNFDMIHIHLWKDKDLARLLRGTKIMAVDEIHKYDGIFGANVHHVIQRLKRISKINQIIGATATLDNAEEFCNILFGHKFELIEGSGKHGTRTFVILAPLRKDIRKTAIELLGYLKSSAHKTLIFNNSRMDAEEIMIEGKRAGHNIAVHRAGLEASYRKNIEAEIKNGKKYDAISSTSTLELGIDIGDLDAVITPFVPYNPLMQRIGRAGRGGQPSYAFMILDPDNPISSYYMTNPEQIFKDNRFIIMDPENKHVKMHHIMFKSKDRPLNESEMKDPLAQDLEKMGAFWTPYENNPDKRKGYWANAKYDLLLEKYSIRDMGQNVEIIKTDNDEFDDWPIPMAYRKLYKGAIYLSKGKVYRVIDENLLDPLHPTVTVEPEVKEDHRTIPIVNIHVENKNKRKQTKQFGLNVSLCDLDVHGEISSYKLRNRYGGPLFPNKPNSPRLMVMSLDKPLRFKLKTTGIEINLESISSQLEDSSEYRDKIYDIFHSIEHLLVHASQMLAGGIMDNLDGHYNESKKSLYIYDNSVNGGNGASKELFLKIPQAFERALEIVTNCPCKRKNGCPRCIHKVRCVNFNSSLHKKGARFLLERLLA